MLPIAGLAADLDHFPVIHARRHNTAVKRLDPFGDRLRHLQAHGDVTRDVIAAYANTVGVDHVLFHEARHARAAASEIDARGAQFLLIFHQRGNARNIRRRGQSGEFQVTALHTVGEVLHGDRINRHHVHVRGQAMANLASGIGQA